MSNHKISAGRQKAEGRGQKVEGRRQKVEGKKACTVSFLTFFQVDSYFCHAVLAVNDRFSVGWKALALADSSLDPSITTQRIFPNLSAMQCNE